jgi:hypothetical protein
MSVDVMAVDSNPVVWAVNCTLCKTIVSESTSDAERIEELRVEHLESHGIEE